MCRFVIVSENSTREELEAAMRRLTEKAERAVIESTLREIRKDHDECLELWVKATH